MKRQLAVAFGLAVVAAPAFATKARLEALGEDNFGSYYINDNRNMFLNPAKINENKDFVTYEFGAKGSSVTTADSAADPRAVGGFVKSHGNMAYGLHFGDSSPSTGAIRALPNGTGTTGNGNLQEQQPWDLHVGGDAGVKWGASLTYEHFDGRSDAALTKRLTSNGLRLRGGAIMGDLEVFAHVSLANKASDNQGNYVKGDMGTFLGAGYMMNSYKLFADWRQIGAEYRGTGSQTTKEDVDTSIIRLGAGRQERLNDRATLFAKAMIARTHTDDDGSGSFGQAGKVSTYVLPLNVGLEYAATSWLDLRASVSQNVWSKSVIDPKASGKIHTNVNNTVVRAGASLKFGEFAIDGLISTSEDGTASGAADTTGGNGQLRSDSLMTRVAMIYRF